MVNLTVIKALKPCPKCERTLAIASELAAQHPGDVEVRAIDVTSPEADTYGVVMPPALFADDVQISNGRIPRKADVAEAMRAALQAAPPKQKQPGKPRIEADGDIVYVSAEEFDETACEAMLLFWHVEEGSQVRKGDELAEVETAKAVFVIEAPTDGTLAQILVREGDAVHSEERLGVIAL